MEIHVEPKIAAIPHFEITLNGRVVACSRDYVSAGITAMAVESDEMRRLIARNGNTI